MKQLYLVMLTAIVNKNSHGGFNIPNIEASPAFLPVGEDADEYAVMLAAQRLALQTFPTTKGYYAHSARVNREITARDLLSLLLGMGLSGADVLDMMQRTGVMDLSTLESVTE